MEIIISVLEETLQYSFEVLDLYQKKMNTLPRGGLYAKAINGNIYYYLSYREGKKVKTDYLGKLSEEEIKNIRDEIAKRKRYERLIKDVQVQIKFLNRALKIKY